MQELCKSFNIRSFDVKLHVRVGKSWFGFGKAVAIWEVEFSYRPDNGSPARATLNQFGIVPFQEKLEKGHAKLQVVKEQCFDTDFSQRIGSNMCPCIDVVVENGKPGLTLWLLSNTRMLGQTFTEEEVVTLINILKGLPDQVEKMKEQLITIS